MAEFKTKRDYEIWKRERLKNPKRKDPIDQDLQNKSAAAAIGLNVIFPGAGYFYLGNHWQGGLAFFLMFLLVIVTVSFNMPFLLFLSAWGTVSIVMLIDMVILKDAYKAAKELSEVYKCPHCAELIKKEAKICRFCKTQLTSSLG